MSSLSPEGALGGPGEEVWTPKNKMLLTSSHTASQVPIVHLVEWSFCLRACVKFQPVGWPGWAWGGLCKMWWREGDNARGSRPHEGALPKKTFSQEVWLLVCSWSKIRSWTKRWSLLFSWCKKQTHPVCENKKVYFLRREIVSGCVQ